PHTATIVRQCEVIHEPGEFPLKLWHKLLEFPTPIAFDPCTVPLQRRFQLLRRGSALHVRFPFTAPAPVELKPQKLESSGWVRRKSTHPLNVRFIGCQFQPKLP